MHALPNNCRAGKFSVYPSNWKTIRANPKLTWRITYWFYDDNLGQKKQVTIKGMNQLETSEEKREVVKIAITAELEDLDNGYNPITNQYEREDENDCEIDENTNLQTALEYALKNVEMDESTKKDVINNFRYLLMSMKSLHYERVAIGQIMPKHIKRILDGCEKIKTYTDIKGKVHPKTWGPYQFNRNRTYLSLLFSNLIENFVIPMNPVLPVKKKIEIKRIRDTVTTEQRTKLRDIGNVQELYSFYRFIQIYFHSDRRIRELIRVRKEDVRLDEQKFKVLMKKGKKYSEIWVTIKTIALPFWEEIYNEAQSGQYLFAEGLKPGSRDKPIRSEQLSRRWRLHIKKRLGITADLASLKHSNLDEIAKLIGDRMGTKQGIRIAQEAAGHSTPVITMRYLPGQAERNHNELKDIGNEL